MPGLFAPQEHATLARAQPLSQAVELSLDSLEPGAELLVLSLLDLVGSLKEPDSTVQLDCGTNRPPGGGEDCADGADPHRPESPTNGAGGSTKIGI